jgi:uncharacterized protein
MPATKDGVLRAIRQMGQLQIDTIHVVARSPYFVLFSRLGAYDPAWLDEHVRSGAVFEAWTHVACFLPREDFALARVRQDDDKPWRDRYREYLKKHQVEVERLLERIRDKGPVRSTDFEREPGPRGAWWDNRKLEKSLLEALWLTGAVAVAYRENFQRVYDLRARVMPEWDTSPLPSQDEAERRMVLRTVKALGITTVRWIPDYYRLPKARVDGALKTLRNDGALLETSIEGITGTAYVHPDNLRLVRQAARGQLIPQRTALLSPFDPIVWDRQRGEQLFDFSYRIECYTPAPKRIYGYFTLPILHRGVLVGRLDAKAHRSNGIFEVKSLHLEPGTLQTEDLSRDLAQAIQETAGWHGTPKVTVTRSDPSEFKQALDASLYGHSDRSNPPLGAH